MHTPQGMKTPAPSNVHNSDCNIQWLVTSVLHTRSAMGTLIQKNPHSSSCKSAAGSFKPCPCRVKFLAS